MEIKILRDHDVQDAVELMIKEFKTAIAPHYAIEGVHQFLMFHKSENFLTAMKEGHLILLGAYDHKLVGVAALRDMSHLQSLFVDSQYQNQHVGSQLLEKVKNLVCGLLTVNAFPGALDFYLKNGFVATHDVQTKDGITYVPMTYQSLHEKQFDNYDQVHDFIASQKSRVYALDHFQKFMNDLCCPQVLLKTIHIGGTNGKGSTTNYVRSVLQKGGYKVATFTSPALETRREVIRINNQYIQEHEIISYANRYMSMWLDYELSMFEIEVFIAILHFIRHRVDFAIFEVGLGGELDATNIVAPILTANTNIGLDHTEYLGDTYAKIAQTKGGIIKDHIPFITGESKTECLDVFREICRQHNSPLMQVRDIQDINIRNHQVTFQYRDYHVILKTPALYQSENSALAIEILLYLRHQGYIEIQDQMILEGLKDTSWAGRFEVVHDHPLIIIDGAHNKEGIEAFYQSAKAYSDIKVIFSALRDKDTHAMIERLLDLTDDVTVCEFDFYRAQSAQKLAESFPVQIEVDWKKAIDQAFLHQGVVFITGSLYFISQVRPYIKSHE